MLTFMKVIGYSAKASEYVFTSPYENVSSSTAGSHGTKLSIAYSGGDYYYNRGTVKTVYGSTTFGGTYNPVYTETVSELSCITISGGRIYIADNADNKIYRRVGISTTSGGSIVSPGTGTNSITVVDGNLISADQDSLTVSVHSGFSTTITDSFPFPSSDVRGITHDGTNLISCDADNIYVHLGISAAIQGSFQIAGSDNFQDLDFDGTHLLVITYPTIYRLGA